ncbi:succinate dehydrogenase cytochrome b subunit [Haloferula chungangensis]|uniref:Succinate dehydrogenase cytochrome b subunit n=1 Tax=Haloferula chungangensis TaxID=1048331 RepID=A0ABW2L2Z0_9BACT
MNDSTRSCPSICRIWTSSIGRKMLVALTGIVLTLFLAGHLAGNLLVFVGREAFNDYAEFLHHMLHGAGVWIARILLLATLVIHVAATISLTRENRAARNAYEHKAVIQAKKSSLIMIWSGLTILAFIIFHLLHFTVRVSYNDVDFVDPLDPERFDAWRMVIVGFTNPLVVLFYIIAMSLLCSHLSHGVQSMFQTLGLRSKKTAGLLDKLSLGYAWLIWLGFVSIPVAILIFKFGR